MCRALVTCLLGVLAASACSKKNPDGLAPPSEWQTQPGASSAPGGDLPPPAPPPGMRGAQSNPHAGMDMGGGDPANPHAGVDMGGTDVTKLGLSAPDPNRKIDPSHRIAGTITADAKAKAKLQAGTAVFLVVKRVGADGAPSGPPLAVDKLSWAAEGTAFELTDAQAMVAGTELTGEVVVTARYDQDADAITKQPGDVTGQAKVKIPADHVKLVLDTVLP